ncbi:MAG: hypothetical protein AB2812_07035, partial [Candidatus Sedimenticola endophacoides]
MQLFRGKGEGLTQTVDEEVFKPHGRGSGEKPRLSRIGTHDANPVSRPGQAHRLTTRAPVTGSGAQVCRYLVKDFGTSQSPKSTRQRDSRYCP